MLPVLVRCMVVFNKTLREIELSKGQIIRRIMVSWFM